MGGGAGPGSSPLTIDLDSSICETFGLKKEGGRFGHTGVRGYHPLLAVRATTGEVLHSRLRGGQAHTGKGAGSFFTECFARVREAGATGKITVRADSGFYSQKVVTACERAGADYSITTKMSPGLRKQIGKIPEEAWVAIPYFLDGADVAETTYRAFAGGKRSSREYRLIVRRVRPTPGTQLSLLTEFSYHAFITNRTGAMLEVEAVTGATPSASWPSATSSTAWASTTCRRGASAPTRRGSPSTPWRTTSPGGSARSVSASRPSSAPRRFAAGSYPSPGASHALHGNASFTFRATGRGQRSSSLPLDCCARPGSSSELEAPPADPIRSIRATPRSMQATTATRSRSRMRRRSGFRLPSPPRSVPPSGSIADNGTHSASKRWIEA